MRTPEISIFFFTHVQRKNFYKNVIPNTSGHVPKLFYAFALYNYTICTYNTVCYIMIHDNKMAEVDENLKFPELGCVP